MNDFVEQARQLGAEAAHLYSVTRRRKEALRGAEQQALQATGTASSPDGEVQVTVDAGGMVTGLELTRAALRRNPGDLAALVTSVIQEAAGQARAAVRDVYEPLRGEGIVRGIPVLMPAPDAEPPTRRRRTDPVEEAPFEERPITRLRR
ncbi:YbaB/EbfC family nucleoid-associated protein [Actinophytocola oryzae]|uniref:YbaB/EbfC DNA-binding family protein n=1 Tax=Actinophytocola oryzae TaxID=502181 RepID=A0A4R7VUT1_9PSEU|nr:YbaB/EbfC family nucleoid-associated protein [Actinophytocola oryzae]TDV53740.1 YbaB/EbfC DNA-binding family protein [Actinophytocola oryzae]